jgi:hypothetical protein
MMKNFSFKLRIGDSGSDWVGPYKYRSYSEARQAMRRDYPTGKLLDYESEPINA